MAKFSFTGDPRAPGTDPKTISMYGIEFAFGVPVEVEDATIAEKLRRHSHFTEGGKRTKQPLGIGEGLKAEHHGGGKFNVTNGETVLLKGLSKADADAFNDMSDEDKSAYVASASE